MTTNRNHIMTNSVKKFKSDNFCPAHPDALWHRLPDSQVTIPKEIIVKLGRIFSQNFGRALAG